VERGTTILNWQEKKKKRECHSVSQVGGGPYQNCTEKSKAEWAFGYKNSYIRLVSTPEVSKDKRGGLGANA